MFLCCAINLFTKYNYYEDMKQTIMIKFKIDNITYVFSRSSKWDNIWTMTFHFLLWKSIL